MFAHMEQHGFHWTDFLDIVCLHIFFQKSVKKIQVSLNLTRKTGTLLEDQYIFLITPLSVPFEMRNASEQQLRKRKQTTFRKRQKFEIKKTHILCSIFFSKIFLL
jgi:hypothetical protein